MIFITSDHHFGHQKIIEYEDRPFTHHLFMTAQMIDNWNRVVTPDDFVIHLGDFSLLDPETTIKICQALQGKIILIKGNHDRRTRTFWEERAGIIKWFKRPQHLPGVWLTHQVDWNYKNNSFKIWTGKLDYVEVSEDDIVLHGHSHGKIRRFLNFINCGVDAWNFTPVPIPAIVPVNILNVIQDWVDELC